MKRAFFASVIVVVGMVAGARLDVDTCYDRGGYFDRDKETCIYR